MGTTLQGDVRLDAWCRQLPQSKGRTVRKTAANTKASAAEAKRHTELIQAQLRLQQQAEAYAGQPVPRAPVYQATPGQEIAQLDALLSQGLISPQEHFQQRQTVIRGI